MSDIVTVMNAVPGELGRGVSAMTAWHVRAVPLPDGDRVVDRWLAGDGWADEPVPGADLLPGRYALPGLVDAHSHVSFGPGSHGPLPLDVAAAQVNRDRWAREGVGLLREAGGDPSVVLALTPEPGRPYVVPATRHLAPAGWYFPAVHLPAESDEVVEVALADVDAGARWVKLVADFAPARAGAVGARAAAARSTGAPAAPEPTYDLDVVRRLVSAAHAVGARVAAHVTTPLSADLVAIGIDSVEHGTAVEEDTVRAMARRGTAWTPTLCAVLSCPPGDAGRRRLVEQRRERFSVLLPFAVGLGVPVLTGSDVVGSVPREVELLVSCGVKPLDALRCATTTATRFLGNDAARASATVVTYDADPREHPDVLGRPAAVVVGGRRVC